MKELEQLLKEESNEKEKLNKELVEVKEELKKTRQEIELLANQMSMSHSGCIGVHSFELYYLYL